MICSNWNNSQLSVNFEPWWKLFKKVSYSNLSSFSKSWFFIIVFTCYKTFMCKKSRRQVLCSCRFRGCIISRVVSYLVESEGNIMPFFVVVSSSALILSHWINWEICWLNHRNTTSLQDSPSFMAYFVCNPLQKHSHWFLQVTNIQE